MAYQPIANPMPVKPAVVQQTTSSLTALNQAQTFTLQGEAGMTFQISGTWVGTITFEASNDNFTNLSSINAQRAGDNTISTTVVNTAGNDLYRLTISGFLYIRAKMTAFTSGTASVIGATSFSASVFILSAPLPTGANTIGGVNIIPATSGGLTTYHLVSAATTNLVNVKASAGQVMGWYIYNSNASARKLAFHNTAGSPTAGASIFFSIVIPATSAANVFGETGIAFSTGIAISTVTGLADTDTTAVALNDLIINIFYK